MFGAVKEPAPLAARAIGTYARGCLSGAVALPIDGPAWQEMRLSRNRNWGHPKLIALIEQFAKDAQKLDGWPGLLVGDIAQPRGGPMITGHASHQVGLDADFWLTPMPDRRLTAKEREDIQATSMLDGTGLAVDPKVFTDKQVALIKRAASYPEVERIFVHPAIKKALCQVAGTDRKWLGKVRPFYGHYYHFHMRIKCPPGFAGCKPQTPPTGADGCGKEVDQWLARVVPAKTPAPPPPHSSTSSKPPKPPIMLSELPKECQALLGAKPDPVPIPRDALMTAAAVRQVLAKAAAVKLALAKAAAVPGATTTAACRRCVQPGFAPAYPQDRRNREKNSRRRNGRPAACFSTHLEVEPLLTLGLGAGRRRARHARSCKPAIAMRHLRQILLVIAFSQIDGSGGLDLCRDRAITLSRDSLSVSIA